MDASGVPRLAEKLEHLFRTVPQADGTPYTNEAAARELGSRLGVSVTTTHISHLRTGRRDNPSAMLLHGLAQLFGVPLAYFFDPERERTVNDQLAALGLLREAQVKSLMMRPGSGDPAALVALAEVLSRIREVEGGHAGDTTDEEGP